MDISDENFLCFEFAHFRPPFAVFSRLRKTSYFPYKAIKEIVPQVQSPVKPSGNLCLSVKGRLLSTKNLQL